MTPHDRAPSADSPAELPTWLSEPDQTPTDTMTAAETTAPFDPFADDEDDTGTDPATQLAVSDQGAELVDATPAGASSTTVDAEPEDAPAAGSDTSGATSRLLSASALMASGTLLSRVFGFIRTAMIAFVLGNGTRQVDMFTLANTVPNSLYILLAGGALNTVLVPQIVRAVKNDPDGGDAYTNRIMTAFMTIIAIVTVLVTLGAPLIVQIYSSQAWQTPELAAQYDSMVTLAYFCLPQIFFYGAFFLAGQVLNARDRFGPMMWAPIANNIVSIIVLSIYLVIWGTGGDGSGAFTNQQELLLGLGSSFGILVQAAILVPYLRSAGFHYRPRFDWRGVGLGHTFSLAKWTLGFVAVTQLALVVVNKLATGATAGGSGAGLTVYNNAYLLWIMPHSLVTVSLATAMLPSASRLAESGDLTGVRRETTRTMRLAVTMLLPVSVGFIALALPITQLLFGNGQGAEDARFIGWALMALAVGLVPFTLHYICLRALYALEDTRSAFVVQVVIAIANVVFAIALVVPFARPGLVAASLGLAYSLAYVVGLAVVFRILQRRLPGLSMRSIVRHLVRLFFAVLPGAVAAVAISWLFARWSTSFGALALGLVAAAVVAVAAFLVGARIFHIDEVRDMVQVLRRRGGSSPAASTDQAPETDQSRENDQDDDSVQSDEETDPGLVRAADQAADPNEVTAGDIRAPEDDALDAADAPSTDSPADDLASRMHRLSLGEDDLPTTSFPPVDPDEEHTVRPWQETPGWTANAGDVLGGRYELEEATTTHEGVQTWRAFDQVLSRSVLVHVLAPNDPRSMGVLDAARRSAVATDARFLRVLDVVVGTDDDTGSYVVSEYSPGRSLHLLLTMGPLSARESAWLVREIADALSAMHAHGLYHERINPDTVIITPTGNIKIVGFLIEAALHPEHRAPEDPERADVQDLGRILYATLVSRWPGADAHGLPAAPQSGSRLMSPRQVRAGVSPALDRVCDQILGDPARHGLTPLATAHDVVNALTTILGTTDASHELEARIRYPIPVVGQREPSADSLHNAYEAQRSQPGVDEPIAMPEPIEPVTSEEPGRRWLSILIAFVLIVFIVSLIGVFVQRQMSTTGPAQTRETTQTDQNQPTGPIEIAAAIDFDPEADGGNGEENPDEVDAAFDGDPETRWRTLSYRGNPQLGGLKPGVGLIVDLGEEREITTVKVLLSGSGTDIELRVPTENRAADQPPMGSQADWQVVAQADGATDEVTLGVEDDRPRTRWLLLYLTSLPAEDGNYRGGIYEIEVSR